MKRYVIIPVSELQDSHLSASEQATDTIRKSLDGTHAVLSFEGDVPAVFAAFKVYKQKRIQEIMASREWTEGGAELRPAWKFWAEKTTPPASRGRASGENPQ